MGPLIGNQFIRRAAGLGPSPGDPECVPSTPWELGWMLGHSTFLSTVRWCGEAPTPVLELGPF